jgi:serine/threonine protein kinase
MGNAVRESQVPVRVSPGQKFGHLEVLEQIGRGAFATVFLARDPQADRTVALKVMRAGPAIQTEVERSMLLREARLAGQLTSPHIVALHRVHELDHGGCAVEMEYVAGPSLEVVLRERPVLPLDESLRILGGVLAALHVAHEGGIIHRDIKPGNVLLGTDSGAVKITDFGLGRQIGEQSLSVSSLTGFAGTPNYVAPEIIMGEDPTTLSDIWSAGVLAHRMLSGSLPFQASALPELFDLITAGDPRPLEGDVPEALKRVVRSCMERHPDDRPASAMSLLGLIREAIPVA